MSDRVPANLQPYVEALGRDLAVEFLLEFGGAEVYVAERPTDRSGPVRLVGREGMRRLAKEVGPGMILVPLARRWLAVELRRQGCSNAEIARRIRAGVSTVRKWFAEVEEEALRKNQLSLF